MFQISLTKVSFFLLLHFSYLKNKVYKISVTCNVKSESYYWAFQPDFGIKREMKHDVLKYILNQPAKFLGHMALDTYRSLDENSSFSLCSLPQQRICHVLKMQLHD